MQLLAEMLVLGPKVKKYNKDHFKTLHKYMEEKSGSGGMLTNIGNALKKSIMESHSNVDWRNFMSNIHTSTDVMITLKLYLEHFAF